LTCPPLICTVRACRRPLTRNGQTCRCERGHSFDIARDGYVNLLQPQDKRSRTAGDSREVVDARALLLGAGIGSRNLSLTLGVVEPLLSNRSPSVVVDLGCGSGEALGQLVSARGQSCGIGIDLSTAAAARAARRFRTESQLTWVVANADRNVPLADASVDLVLSIQGRRNPDECRRILVDRGRLLVSVPAPDDLIELREYVQGVRAERDRVRHLIEAHEPGFCVVGRTRISERHTLARDALVTLLRGTYRGTRTKQSERVASLEQLAVTLASEVVLFQKRM
jgi:23S rRNA (guanine745-N1)-methyltransferase